ncbi:MAG TPA: amidohydrolase family protein [Candidatus Limnocylindrales bacterium]|nr:amidohydrolase family protein [Candidatus Limnocylindrales bacterium]
MTLAIVGARLLDARSETPLDGDTLVVGDDGRIASIGRGRGSVPDGATIVDAAGATVVPGLIDCHVHFLGRHERLEDAISRTYTEQIGDSLAAGKAFLESGVTTIRDAGGAPAGLKRLFAAGWPGPRLQVSVSPLSITGGHGDGMSPSGIVLDGDRPMTEIPPSLADGPDEIRKVVRANIRAGADWIKTFSTGGVYSMMDAPGAVQYSVDEIRVMVEEAQLAGIHGVLAHAENAAGIKNAVRAGVRSIEHGDGIDDEAIDLMLEREVPLVPTFQISYRMLEPDLVARGITPPWAVEKQTALMVGLDRNFRHAAERGVRIAMGTDGVRGEHLPRELSHMVDHGLSPLASLRAATMEAARLLDLGDQVGTIEAGKLADVILVNGDPLTEPGLWSDPARVVAVVQAGRLVADRR